ncbi:MAG: phosphatase PAP2 family protein [Sphingobacteriales bacterium]|nr:MAG: phosphatase PAP2 family protein [Sphingobacteriales bacterium]
MEQLLYWDQVLFHAINSGLANPFFDWLMPLFRNQFIWLPVYIFFAGFFVYNFPPKGFYILLFGLLTFLLSDQLSSHIIKPLVERLRPCNDPFFSQFVRSLIPCGSGFSFPSSHATNHFAFSVFLISIIPFRMRWVLPFALFWAFGVAFAQVYVGIHYPIDVIFGAFLGSLIGMSVSSLCKSVLNLNLDRVEGEDEVIENEPEEWIDNQQE